MKKTLSVEEARKVAASLEGPRDIAGAEVAKDTAWDTMQALIGQPSMSKRDLDLYDAAERVFDEAEAFLARANERSDLVAADGHNARVAGDGTGRTTSTRRDLPLVQDVALRDGESFEKRVRDKHSNGIDTHGLTPGAFLLAQITGRHDFLTAEQRTLLSGGTTTGGFSVPSPLSARIIDLARNQARVAQAGAQFVPMTTSTQKFATVATVPAGQWRGEGDTINEENITLGQVDLSLTGVATLVKWSWEFEQDTLLNAQRFVEGIIAESIALAIDKAALYGSGTDDQPTGLLESSEVIALDVLGTPTDYDFAIDAIAAIRAGNISPNAVIYSDADDATLQKMKTGLSGDKTTLVPPAAWTNLNRLTTNQVDEGDAFFGDFSQFLWGSHVDGIAIKLDQRYADTGEVGVVVQQRVDFAVQRANAFAVHGNSNFDESP